MRRFFLVFSLLAVSAFVVAGWGYRQYMDFLYSAVFGDSPPEAVTVSAGSSFQRVVSQLKANGATGEWWQWRLLGHLSGLESQLQAGEYSFGAGITPPELLRQIAQGRVKTYDFTIVEGQNWRQLRSQLLENPVLEHPLADMDDAALLAWLGSNKPSPEGLFLPETWQFRRGDSDLDILKRAYQAMDSALQSAWENRADGLPLKTPYELLILASIVEKETALADEKPQVAGVFVRRLLKGMRLQTDPTVIYGVGESFDGDITYAHLRTDTPYNTYTRKGLPPTPISMPGRDSLHAVANPASGDALYFVADGRGGHVFSRDFANHKKAVKRYVRQQKEKTGVLALEKKRTKDESPEKK